MVCVPAVFFHVIPRVVLRHDAAFTFSPARRQLAITGCAQKVKFIGHWPLPPPLSTFSFHISAATTPCVAALSLLEIAADGRLFRRRHHADTSSQQS